MARHANGSSLCVAGCCWRHARRGSRRAASPPRPNFRKSLGIGPEVRLDYRNLECQPVDFEGFVADMRKPGAHADVDRAADGRAVTMTAKLRGMAACPSPYPPVTEMPPFDLKDLAGKRVTSASLKGKPTLISFFFSTCVPCILEVAAAQSASPRRARR